MKTIVHLIDTTGPGGAETVFTDLVRELPRDHYRSIPVVAGPGWVLDTLLEAGSDPIILPTTGIPRRRYLWELTRTCRRLRADIVHGHLVGSSLYGSLAARLSGAQSVCTFHGPADLPADDRHRRLRFSIIERAASHINFVSESLRSWVLESTPLSGRNTSVIYNGVDTALFEGVAPAGLRGELGLSEDVLLLGALGNVRAPKGYEHLLESLALLSRDPPWHLVIVGDTSGDVFPRVLARRSELGLDDRVSFTGFRHDVAAVLRSFDLFVLSSLTEGFSLATVQALASGLPVVATRSGGPEEILVDGESGILVAPGDPTELAAALQRLISDTALQRSLASAGRKHVQARFSLTAMVSAYCDVYDSIST